MARKKRKIDYSTFIPWLEPKTRAQKSQFILLQQQQQQQQQQNVIVIDNDNNNEESNNIRNSHFLNNADDNSNANNSSKKKKKKKKRKRLNNEELLQQQQQQQNNVIVIHNDNNNEESNNIRNSHFRNNTDDNSNAKCSAPKKKEKYNAKKKKEKKKKRRLIKEETLRRERNERNERNSAKRKRDEYENEDVLQKKNTRMGKKMEGTNKPEKKKKKGWKLKRKEKAKNKKKESRMHQMSNLLPHERQQHYHTSNVPWLSFKGNDSYENSEKSISSPSLSTTANNNKQQRQKVLLLPKSYYNLNPLVLNQFQKELTQFEQYIKLQPEEISARQHVIDYVTSLAKILFENDAYNHQDTIHTEIYGSFKSLQVCNFNSDVDMALWGAIDVTLLQDEEDDEEAGRGWFSRFKKRRQGKENKNEQVAKTITTAEEEKIAKKKRVAKWRDVLNTTQIDQEQQLSSSSELKSTGTNPVTSDCSNSGSDENCTDKDNHSNKESQNHHKDSNDDDESNDDADKMENYKRGCNNNGKKRGVIEEKESDDQSINFHACFNSATIDLCSSSSNSSSNETYDKNDDDDTTNMEISYVNIPNDNDNTTTSTKKRTQLPTLTRSARQKVVGALYQLRKKLHKSSIIDRVEVRAKARVPILCVSTCFGFDFDLSLGGQNGADTTNYVQAQVKRFKSFPTVALFLKALMQQTDLDKPFTGGLGSYRLYVLLAYHVRFFNFSIAPLSYCMYILYVCMCVCVCVCFFKSQEKIKQRRRVLCTHNSML